MDKPYCVPLSEIRRENVVMNSRFIATLAPAISIEEAQTFIARVKKEFADASHNVPAYIIGGGNTVSEASPRWPSCEAVDLAMRRLSSHVISAGPCSARADW
jgi:hypothetical protein